MATVLLVHGFASKGGRGSTDKLRPYFEREGYRVYELDYTRTFLPTYTRSNKKLAMSWVGWARAMRDLQKDLTGETHLIGLGHSNGSPILRLSSWLGAPFTQLVFMNPALNTKGKKTRVGPTVKRVHVWHARSDYVVRFASYIPWHPWGKMGAVGYKGKDPRYVNYDQESEEFGGKKLRHGKVFSDKWLEVFGPMVVRKVTESLDSTPTKTLGV